MAGSPRFANSAGPTFIAQKWLESAILGRTLAAAQSKV
jgi:hypothetical protein